MESLLHLVEYEETHRECCLGATTKEQEEALKRANTSLENKDVKVDLLSFAVDFSFSN